MSAPLINKKNMDRYIGQRVRLFGKYAIALNEANDGFITVMSTDGVEVKCRMGQGILKPTDPTGSGVPRVVVATGRVEADGTLTLDAPVADLGTDMDMSLMDESINLQFRKEFSHLFYAPGSAQTSYA